MPRQLSLPVQLPDGLTFDSFVEGDNQQLLDHLLQLSSTERVGAPITVVWGESGVGKSHVLFALCQQAHSQQNTHIYLDLAQRDDLTTAVTEGLEQVDIVCLDNIHAIAGDKHWQQSLFDLINRVIEANQGCLVITANTSPTSLPLELADLKSRLSWGVSYQLKALGDDDKLIALIKRAEARGLVISEEVGRFLCTHLKRDMPSLMGALARLDDLSLQQQRRLTIPFVKHALNL